MGSIKYIRHKKIDKAKWDKAIDDSYNGLVYAYSFVLDNMAGKRWDALVLGDYEAVFPLVWGRKFGIPFLYQPYFCQQHGLFSKELITAETMQEFMKAIPGKFRYWHFHLNARNVFFDPQISFINRTTYQVDLNKSYPEIYDQYNADAKKNLARSAMNGYTVNKDIDAHTVLQCFHEAHGNFYPGKDSIFRDIINCQLEAIKLGKGFTRTVYGKDGQLWCTGFFFFAKGRIHYAMAAPTAEGKKFGAMHVLIDEVLKEFAGQPLVFDFEGSDIKSVAYFYSKFGSTPVHYLEIINNKLPWLVRVFMKKD